MNNLYKPACISTKKFPLVYWRVCIFVLFLRAEANGHGG